MSKQHWSEYWRMGMLTSLPADFLENYDGELATYWKGVVDSLDDNSKVIDLCTGNGAIAILIKERSIEKNKSIHMTAVDASSIQPNLIIQKYPNKKQLIDEIEFISECYVEDVCDVLKGRYDLIVSQYGIEYCETQSAAESVFQLLNNDGQFVFVAHSPDTAMLEYMKVEEQVFQLLEDIKVFESFNDFSTKKSSTNGFKNKLKAFLDTISQHQLRTQTLLKTWGQNTYQLFHMNNQELKQQRVQVGLFLAQNLHARERAKDMLNVSKKLADPHWIEPFKKVGLVLKNDGQIKYQDKHNVGHYYEFHKS